MVPDNWSGSQSTTEAPPALPLSNAGGNDGADLRTFVAAAVRNPQRVGAIYPSSARLAALLASVVPTVGEPVVVELGAGTGSVSSAISQRAPRGARHLALELDTAMATYLGEQHPFVEVVNADARDLGAVLAAREISEVAAVVSGLPWSLFNPVIQERILRQVADAIGLEGVFTTFAYAHAIPMPSARNFRRALEQTFDEVDVSGFVLRNMPPAFSYVCRRPKFLDRQENGGTGVLSATCRPERSTLEPR